MDFSPSFEGRFFDNPALTPSEGPRLEPVAWFCNSSYLGGRNLELLRSLSPGEFLSDLSSVRNSLASATDAARVQSEGQGKLWEGFNLLV